jgi:hypothetical protein
MAGQIRLSKIEGLRSMCQQGIKLMEAMGKRSQDINVLLSDEAREWCL